MKKELLSLIMLPWFFGNTLLGQMPLNAWENMPIKARDIYLVERVAEFSEYFDCRKFNVEVSIMDNIIYFYTKCQDQCM